MEEDEDVILSHSPLDEYLQQVSDIPFSRYTDNHSTYLSNELYCYESKTTEHNVKLMNQMLTFIGDVNKRKHDIEILKSCQELLNSSILSEDDQDLLMDMRDQVFNKLITVTEGNTDWSLLWLFNIDIKYVYYAILVLLVSIIASIIMLPEQMQYCMLTLLALATIFIYFYFYWRKKSYSEMSNCIKKFVKTFDQWEHLVDKSINHLKEVEVINHGVRIFHNKLPGTDILTNSSKKCLKLQNCLMDALTELFVVLHTHERTLIQNYMEQLSVYKEEFIASIPLIKFNEVLINEKLELQLPTIPLSKLKTMVYLYRTLLSEFVFSLIVCMHYKLDNTSKKRYMNDIVYVSDQITIIQNKHFGILQDVLNKSIATIFNKEEKSETCSKKRIELVNSKENIFNSCKLNIYSSLNRMEELQELVANSDIEENKKIDLNALENLILQFTLNLDNARSCIEDIYEIYKPKKAAFIDATDADIESEKINVNNPQTFVPKEEEGDLMFEGESRGVTVSQPESIEELERAAKESRESRKLLRELKTIFAVKESPVGLLSFPLKKVSEEDINTDAEESKDEGALIKKHKGYKIKQENYDGNYEGESTGYSIDAEIQESVTRIGLPMSFLQNLPTFPSQCEEKFGSSSEDEEGVI